MRAVPSRRYRGSRRGQGVAYAKLQPSSCMGWDLGLLAGFRSYYWKGAREPGSGNEGKGHTDKDARKGARGGQTEAQDVTRIHEDGRRELGEDRAGENRQVVLRRCRRFPARRSGRGHCVSGLASQGDL